MAPIITLDVASDRRANLVVRLCDVHPSGESLRVSYGVLNLTHRDGPRNPALLAIESATGCLSSSTMQLARLFPAGHKGEAYNIYRLTGRE